MCILLATDQGLIENNCNKPAIKISRFMSFVHAQKTNCDKFWFATFNATLINSYTRLLRGQAMIASSVEPGLYMFWSNFYFQTLK